MGAKKQTAVTAYLAVYLEQSEKTQAQIAEEIGFENNMITMLKKGYTKVPPAKAGALARALDADPRELLELVLKQDKPELWGAIEQELLDQPRLTQDEVRMIETFRAGGVDVAALLSKLPKGRSGTSTVPTQRDSLPS